MRLLTKTTIIAEICITAKRREDNLPHYSFILGDNRNSRLREMCIMLSFVGYNKIKSAHKPSGTQCRLVSPFERTLVPVEGKIPSPRQCFRPGVSKKHDVSSALQLCSAGVTIFEVLVRLVLFLDWIITIGNSSSACEKLHLFPGLSSLSFSPRI